MHEVSPFPTDDSLAVALATVLVREEADETVSVPAVAEEFDVDRSELAAVITGLGFADRFGLSPCDGPSRVPDESLSRILDREPITREYAGLRDPPPDGDQTRETTHSFQNWLWTTAGKRGREQIRTVLEERLDGDLTGIRVATRAAPTAVAFPDRLVWIGVGYLTDATDPGRPPAVPDLPTVSFDRLASVAPHSVAVELTHDGESFRVTLPVVVYEEPRS